MRAAPWNGGWADCEKARDCTGSGVELSSSSKPDLGDSKIQGTLLGVLLIRIIMYWGLRWGTPHFWKPPFGNVTMSLESVPQFCSL